MEAREAEYGAYVGRIMRATGFAKMENFIGSKPNSSLAFTQLFYRNNHAIVYFDDQCRADRQNPDLVEITHAEFDRLVGNE